MDADTYYIHENFNEKSRALEYFGFKEINNDEYRYKHPDIPGFVFDFYKHRIEDIPSMILKKGIKMSKNK